MVCIFTEGFDKYGNPNGNAAGGAPTLPTLLAQGDWTSVTGATATVVAGLSVTGGALSLGANQTISRTLGVNYARLIGGVRFSCPLTASGQGITLVDTATAQCSINVNNTGTISIRTGAVNGTAIQTSTATVTANSTHYLEWDITIAASGAYQVWLDGVSILSGTGATRSTANNYANVFQLVTIGSSTTIVFDDLYLFDTTGSVNNAVLLTAPRIETTFPTSDASVQFTASAATLGGSIARAGTASTAANLWWVRPLTPARNCTLNSLTVLPGATNASVNLRGIVYADSAGVPGTLLTSGSTITSMTAGTMLGLPLTTPQSLTAGTQYWLGLMCDTAVVNGIALADALSVGRSGTSTFASGAPSTPPSNSSQTTPCVWGNITLAASVNWYEVAGGINGPPNPGQSYVSDSTVGHEDLYGMAALTTNPVNLYAVATKVYWEKSDAGARTMSVRVKSSATEVASSAIAPGTTYTWAALYNDTDPATSLAWTLTAVNAAQAGFRIET